jgi:hypothetical protein
MITIAPSEKRIEVWLREYFEKRIRKMDNGAKKTITWLTLRINGRKEQVMISVEMR